MKEDLIQLIENTNKLLTQHSQLLQNSSGKVVGESKEAFEAIEAFGAAIVATDDLLEIGEDLVSKLQALKPEDWNDNVAEENQAMALQQYRNTKTGRVRKGRLMPRNGNPAGSSFISDRTHYKIRN